MEADLFIEGINKKQEFAWRKMYRQYYPALCNYASKIVKDADEAEDIVQECFIKIWDTGTQFPNLPSLAGFLYKSVYTKALNAIRDKGIAQASYEKWADSILENQSEEMAIELAVEEDVVNKFYEVIDQLPEQQRQILLLSAEGLKVREIADRLRISENSIKTQKKRAYAFIRENLGKEPESFLLPLFLGLAYLI